MRVCYNFFMISIQNYEEKYAGQIEKLFEDFQGYLSFIDPLKRFKRYEDYGRIQLQEALQRVKDQDGVFYAALDGDTVAGFIVGVIQKHTIYGRPDVVVSKSGRVQDLYVEAGYRGKGIGSELMRRVEEYFRKQGCDAVNVSVFAPN